MTASEAAQNFLALNIVLALVAVITLFLMTMWFRFTIRRWPNRKELLIRIGVSCILWGGCDLLYFYLKSR